MATTYRKLSQIILDRHYNGIASDDATISERHVAELIAMEVAWFARKDAFENSSAGEVTFANEQFISVWNNLPLLTDSDTKEMYVVLPATPAGLPNNTEISSVAFTAYPNSKVVPLRQKDIFAQSFLPMPKGVYNYKIENGRIVFVNLGKLVDGTVSLKMVGAVSGAVLLDSVLNIPKQIESDLIDRVLQKLDPRRGVARDILNDSQSLPV
jgi:hypothetical protein